MVVDVSHVAVEGVGIGVGHWYCSQYGGRYGCAPRVWRITRPSGRVSSSKMTLLAAVSAVSLPRMPVCERNFRRVVEYPLSSRLRIRPSMASRRCLRGECGLEAGLVISARSICGAVRESVAMRRSGSFMKVSRGWWMATNSARRTVLFSSSHVASIRISIEVDGCITAAPCLGLGSIFEPSV